MVNQSPLARSTTSSSQPQAFLFGIPLEVREHIYAYYAYEDDGCFYDSMRGKFRYFNGRRLDLLYTCKAIASELPSVLLRTNKLTFTSAYSDPNECQDSGYRGLRSRAGRFECILHYVRWTKVLMLRYAAPCITDEMLEEVVKQFPGVDGYFRYAFRAITYPTEGFLQRYAQSPHEYRDILFASFCDAVQYALELASSHKNFERLVSKACARSHGTLGRSPFIYGSHRKLLDWKPKLWSHPTEEDLATIEDLLDGPRRFSNARGTDDEFVGIDCVKEYRRLNWYFSATSVAVGFLERLTPRERMGLRQIVLNETRKGVANPECHLEGLIPFCRENPNLCVTMQASLHTNLAPSIWVDYDYRDIEGDEGQLRIDHYLNAFVDWVTRTEALTSQGMPLPSFSLVIDTAFPETDAIWTFVKKAAAYKEAILDCAQRHEGELIEPYESFEEVFLFPWCLPSTFPAAIRNIVQGTSIIRYGDDAGELWDNTDLVRTGQDWSADDWMDSYMPGSYATEYYPVPGGARTLFDLYSAPGQAESQT